MQDIIQQLEQKRAAARLGGGQKRIDAGLKQNFRGQASVKALLPELTQKVITGQVPASTAARQLLAAYQATGFPKN